MEPQSTISITQSTLILAFLGSTVVATVIGFVLNWIKDHYQSKGEREDLEFEELYGPIKFHLMKMDLLEKNRNELMREKMEHKSKDENYNLEINSLNEKWWSQAEIIDTLIGTKPGYIREKDFELISDFVDGLIKRDIIGRFINKGTALSNEERLSGAKNAVEALKRELLKQLSNSSMER